MWIKICGITRPEDALAACSFGSDAIGFVFAMSPRRISPDQAKEISLLLKPDVSKVGVFVNSPVEEVEEIMEFCGLDLAQFHGDEDESYFFHFKERAIKAIRVKENRDIIRAGSHMCHTVLLDGYHNGSESTDREIDWRLAQIIAPGKKIVVAGGLNNENVGDVIRQTRPFGVDVSSGIESEAGIKDHILMYRFIESARKAAYEVSAS